MSPMGKRADIGWFASHRHDAAGSNEPYAYSYLFAYAIDVPSSASTFTLPRNHIPPRVEHLNNSNERFRHRYLTTCRPLSAHKPNSERRVSCER